MVRDAKYIWHGISYQKLKDILKENRKLRGFPLVDNPDSMILLGSIQRLELIKLIEKHIGRERRLQVRRETFIIPHLSPRYSTLRLRSSPVYVASLSRRWRKSGTRKRRRGRARRWSGS